MARLRVAAISHDQVVGIASTTIPREAVRPEVIRVTITRGTIEITTTEPAR